MKRVLETVCSFLNTAGGTLVVGVEDQTRVVLGLDDVEKQEERLGPGTWPPGFSREDFESGVSLRRNKAISRVLMRLGVIEGYGSGYDRIVAACREGGYPEPEWIENGPQIKVILRPHPASSLSAQSMTHGPNGGRERSRLTVEERDAAVVAAIDNLERPNTADIQRQTGLSTRSLGRDLRRLRDAGVIEFVGSPKTGFYRRA